MADEDAEEEGDEAGGYVVEHDADAFGEGFEASDGPGLGDVEGAEEKEGDERVKPVGAHEDEGEELAGDLVDDDEAGVFAAGLAGDGSGGGDADEGDEDGGDECCDRQGGGGGGNKVRGEVPEHDGGGAAVGSGAGFEIASAEPGG